MEANLKSDWLSYLLITWLSPERRLENFAFRSIYVTKTSSAYSASVSPSSGQFTSLYVFRF